MRGQSNFTSVDTCVYMHWLFLFQLSGKRHAGGARQLYRHMARFEALERADGATRRVPAVVTPLFLSRVAARERIVLDKELRYIF